MEGKRYFHRMSVMHNENIQIFEELASQYDQWFDSHRFAYESELLATKKFIPPQDEGYACKGLEVGVGTGRFAAPLGIRVGVEPAKAMAELAQKRGVRVCRALAEELPFPDESFDFVLMVTTICFLQDPFEAIREAKRVLKPGGLMIIGMIDMESPPGQFYKSKKSDSEFYKYAHFYSVKQILEWLRSLEYKNIKTCQTLFKDPEKLAAIEPIKNGYGGGSFVVISAQAFYPDNS